MWPPSFSRFWSDRYGAQRGRRAGEHRGSRSHSVQLDPLVDPRPFGSALNLGASSPLAANLGTAAMLGAVLMLLSAIAYVAMSRDRIRAFRALLTRFALGALSFAVLLRIGSWPSTRRGIGAIPGELRPSGELEMDGAADYRPRRDGRGDRLSHVPSAGQTGGNVPLRRRAAHTPRSMTPVTMRMALTHLVGRGLNPPRARNMYQAHPPTARTRSAEPAGDSSGRW